MSNDKYNPKEFYTLMYSDCKGYIEIRLFEANGSIKQHWIKPDGISKYINPSDSAVYHGCATREYGKGNKEGVMEVPFLWVDIDFKDTSKEEAMKRLNECPLQPNFIIHSGGGLHCYWKLKEPFVIEKSDDIEIVEGYLKRLAAYLNGDMSCSDVARILRVPGTRNNKYTPPKDVYIYRLEMIKEYILDDFEILPEFKCDKNSSDTDKELDDSSEWLSKAMLGVKEGNRNTTATRIGGYFINKLTANDVRTILLSWNQNNDPPLEEKEILKVCESVSRYRADAETKLHCITISEFLDMEFPPRENVLSPFLPTQGVVMVHAIRGVGKTFFGLNIAVAVASGGKYLRFEAPKARSVVYLDGEMPAVVMRDRLRDIIRSSEKELIAPLKIITPDLQQKGMVNLTTPEGQESLEPHLEGTSLVIVDNISTLCRGGRENEAESWLPVQEWALRLRTRGMSILFIHHAGKSGSQRGTSRREDILDTVIYLKHPVDYEQSDGARFEVHFEKARGIYGDDVKSFETILKTSCDDKTQWEVKNFEHNLTERVAELLNEGEKQKDIAEILNVSKGTVSKHKTKASEQGLLKKKT